MKERERELGVTKEKVAQKSCVGTTELEQNLCSLNGSATNKEDVVHMKSSCDIGVQRKGSGKAYNNVTRFGDLIGIESEKTLNYGTQVISNCKQCEMNKVAGRVKEQGCRMELGR